MPGMVTVSVWCSQKLNPPYTYNHTYRDMEFVFPMYFIRFDVHIGMV